MERFKEKQLTTFLSFICCLLFVFAAKTPVLAFGGEHTFKDPSTGGMYTKENHSQISTSFDGNGNLVIEGYSFFTYTQQYLSKGTSSTDTHSYRLKIEGTDFVFNDVLSGADSNCHNYTEHALDANVGDGNALSASKKFYCSGTQTHNTQLQDVSFKFIIGKEYLVKLEENETNRLILECTLNNIMYSSTGSQKHKEVIDVTKLIDVNFANKATLENSNTADGYYYTVSVYSPGFENVRVNAGRVVARDSNLNKFYAYNGGYFVKSYDLDDTARDKVRAIADTGYIKSSGAENLIGAIYVPQICQYNSTTSNMVSISLDEYFKNNPSISEEYIKNRAIISANTGVVDIILAKAKNCVDMLNHNRTASKLGTACKFCLNENDYYRILNDLEIAKVRNAEIESSCHKAVYSSSSKTATLYCKALYLEAPKDDDYWTSIKLIKKVEEKKNVTLISQAVYEKVNDTIFEKPVEVGDRLQRTINNISGDEQTVSYYSTPANIKERTGYHIVNIYNNMTHENISNNINLPYGKSFRGSAADFAKVDYNITITYTYKNDKASIKKK